MEFSLDQKIIHQLLLRSNVEWNIGLYHGKMGLILFFAHYFELTKHPVYRNTADELMEELMEEIHTELPVDFSSGLSGIGWGMEYLIQKGLVEGDSLEVCEEIDKKIMEKDPKRMTDFSIEKGLGGIIHYVLFHIKGVHSQHSELPFDETYLRDLYQAVSNIPRDCILSDEFRSLSVKYSGFYNDRTKIDYLPQLLPIIDDFEVSAENLNNFPLGLNKGLSGFLLKNLIKN